jgi:endonuclease/exonuclease/phosphatase family metal-dependent hydrolase
LINITTNSTIYNIKIISLNAWCGRAGSILYDFFENNKDIDIFCLQEVDLDGSKFDADVIGNNTSPGDPSLFTSIQNIIPQHHGYFSPCFGRWCCNAIFVKESLYENVVAYGDLIVTDKQQKYASYKTWLRRTIQWSDLDLKDKKYTIINFHGLWEKGKGKNDSPDRIEQSQNIINFLYTKKDRKIILVGDFNLNPDTKSIALFEDFGLRNLINEYYIPSTRTQLYTKDSSFADYAFTSPEIKIKKFKVLPDVVSDHTPLYLEIE